MKIGNVTLGMLGVLVASFAVLPATSAWAGDRDHRDRDDRHGRGDHNRGGVVLQIGPGYPAIVQRWVPGHTELRTEQVLVEPGYYTTRTEDVLVEDGHWEARYVPAVAETRRDAYGRLYTAIVAPARTDRLWVAPQYETRTVRVWCPAQYDTRTVEVWVPGCYVTEAAPTQPGFSIRGVVGW